MRVIEALGHATYYNMFEDAERSASFDVASSPLQELALVSSGITMGRRTQQPTQSVPYVTVANVQDRRLELRTVKTIEATAAEIERYRLRAGDLLLTEGGDPDKLGRGTLWRDELETCIHQNHVFRVRVTREDLLDRTYLNWHVGSRRGKSYFLRSAKQTTGIASINSTQLKGFPVILPPLREQRQFARRIGAIGAMTEKAESHLRSLDRFISGLQYRAFRKEL
jgi:type I restriction enzyme S subunit